jgi:hypothetical protein
VGGSIRRGLLSLEVDLMKVVFPRLISETVLVLRLVRSLYPRLSLLWTTLMVLGAGMVLLGNASAKQGSMLVELGFLSLITGIIQMLFLLFWAISSLRTGRKLLADPDTRITFRDDRVELYLPEITIREKVTVHNRLVESETTIRPYRYTSLPSWIMDDPLRYRIKLPPSPTVEKE